MGFPFFFFFTKIMTSYSFFDLFLLLFRTFFRISLNLLIISIPRSFRMKGMKAFYVSKYFITKLIERILEFGILPEIIDWALIVVSFIYVLINRIVNGKIVERW